MDPQTNPWTRQSYGAPPGRHGSMGLWLSARKQITSAYVPDRWQRRGLLGWMSYWLSIPSVRPGIWQVGPEDTLEFEAVCPVNFAVAGIMQHCNQPEGALVELYDVENDQAFINPGGPALRLANLGGDAKHPFFLKRLHPMNAGNSILVDITNLSETSTNTGQIVLFGYQPVFPGELGK